MAGRMASLAATYAVELYGTQEHCYTAEAYCSRFDATFPEFAGAIRPDWIANPANPDWVGRPLVVR